MWQVLLMAIPTTIVLFLGVFRTLFAGPEISVFVGVNISILGQFLWKLKKYQQTYCDLQIRDAKLWVTGYTVFQSIMTAYVISRYDIRVYASLGLVFTIVCCFKICDILTIPPKAET